MPDLGTNLGIATGAIRAQRLRAILTVLGITMGVATLMAVVTMVQGANTYVEQKIANLGTNVFQVGKFPFASTNFDEIIRARKNRDINAEDLEAVRRACTLCEAVGGQAEANAMHVRNKDQELQDQTLYGQTSTMSVITTRTLQLGRYFTDLEEQHQATVCLIGDNIREKLFTGMNPIGQTVRVGKDDLIVIGVFDRIGSILGQEADNFLVIPLPLFLRMVGTRHTIIVNAKAGGGEDAFQAAQDQARLVMRGRRHITGTRREDFYIGTAESYIALWKSISSSFVTVFLMVSSIAAIVGGIVIMNVMLVSVTERTKEIGIRRACGARQGDILRQFLAESVLLCVLGGAAGVLLGFGTALAVRTLADFPATVRVSVAVMGVVLSSAIGLFFGIYPAVKASRLDPVVALRAD